MPYSNSYRAAVSPVPLTPEARKAKIYDAIVTGLRGILTGLFVGGSTMLVTWGASDQAILSKHIVVPTLTAALAAMGGIYASAGWITIMHNNGRAAWGIGIPPTVTTGLDGERLLHELEAAKLAEAARMDETPPVPKDEPEPSGDLPRRRLL